MMTQKRYVQALKCEKPDVVPHQLYLNHPEFIKEATGIDYYENPLQASLRFHEMFDVDNGGPVAISDEPLPRPQTGESEDGGQIRDEGFNTIWHTENSFTEPQQLWDFDPDPWGPHCQKAVDPSYATKNYRWCFEPETWDQRRQQEDEYWAQIERLYPGKFTDARSFYCTSFMWAICIFGWEVFLTALGLDPEKTGQTIVRISQITERMYQYFGTCDKIEFAVAHDDLCITSGPVVNPQWYLKYIYPEYEKIFTPIKVQGKPMILLSDGDISKLAKDAATFVDGFIFESSTPTDFMFDNFGMDKCLIGGIDVRPLTFGSKEEVDSEVKNALTKGKEYPGYVACCADTIPANVPIENVYAYFQAIEKYRYRK